MEKLLSTRYRNWSVACCYEAGKQCPEVHGLNGDFRCLEI